MRDREGVMRTNCYTCQHMREVPGTCHIQCAKPDPAMTGDKHGISHGWFMYPFLYDPVWCTSECANYTEVTPAKP